VLTEVGASVTSFEDYAITNGSFYYRVLAVNSIGAVTTSSIVSAKSNCTFEIHATNLYPNPATNEVFVTIESALNTNLLFEVKDMTGRTVITQTTGIIAGVNKVRFDIAGLANASYFITIAATNGMAVESMKFVKVAN
jgi:hypothetical protein